MHPQDRMMGEILRPLCPNYGYRYVHLPGGTPHWRLNESGVAGQLQCGLSYFEALHIWRVLLRLPNGHREAVSFRKADEAAEFAVRRVFTNPTTNHNTNNRKKA